MNSRNRGLVKYYIYIQFIFACSFMQCCLQSKTFWAKDSERTVMWPIGAYQQLVSVIYSLGFSHLSFFIQGFIIHVKLSIEFDYFMAFFLDTVGFFLNFLHLSLLSYYFTYVDTGRSYEGLTLHFTILIGAYNQLIKLK